MFKIKGADQKEYGPVTAEGLRQWIAERRIDGRTLIQAEGSALWKPVADFPEFAPALGAGARPPSPVPALPPMSSEPAKTSGMAIASLVCGVLGCLGITAIVGVILGIVAQVKISRSNGRLKGSGLAIAGICISGVMLFLASPLMAAMLLPALAKAKNRAQAINCVSNLKQLALGARLYAGDNKDTFPVASTWCDTVKNELGGGANLSRVFVCHSAPGQSSGYAMNKAVAGKKTDDVAGSTVLFFEADAGWNASGGLELAIKRARHGMVNVAFADGHVEQLPISRLPSLRWEP